VGAVAARGALIHWAGAYDALVWLMMGGRERAFRQRLLSLAALEPGESVLDAGCGTGSLAIAAKQAVGNSRVEGIDASPEMIARAARKARQAGVEAAFQVASVESLPWPDHTFDVALNTMMLHHLPRDLRRRCVREMRRVLKPEGRVLAVDFDREGANMGFIGRLHQHGSLRGPQMVELFRDEGFAVRASGPVGVKNLFYVLATAG